MKKVGIIGGAGPYASALFYETMIQESYREGSPLPEIFLINYSFTREVTSEDCERNEELLLKELEHCVRILERNGVDIGVIVCNTLHIYLRKLSGHSLSFLPLPETVMEKAIANGDHRLLILATQNTCRSHLYQHPEIEPFYPSEKEQRFVEEVINRILEGKILEEDSTLISRLIEEMAQRIDFKGVVFGCTDLPVLHHRFPVQASQRFYDSIKIPAKALRNLL